MTCPRCRAPLTPHRGPHGHEQVCAACEGHALTLSVTRKSAGVARYRSVWSRALGSGPPQGPPCPGCSQPMQGIRVPADELEHDHARGPLELDLCRRCQLVWFDAGEKARVTQAPGVRAPAPSTTPDTAGAMARERVRLDQERRGQQDRAWAWVEVGHLAVDLLTLLD